MNSLGLSASRTVATDRNFYLGMAISCALIVLLGFAPSFFLRSLNDLPPLPVRLHVHGAIFVAWMALFIAQTGLVRADRRDLHRRLGIAGSVLAAAVVGSGYQVAMARVASGASVGIMPPAMTAASLLTTLAFFTIFVATAICLRDDRESHKRLMLLANISILGPAIARFHWEIFGIKGPPLGATIALLLIVPGVVYDWRTRGRVHSVYILGGLALVVTLPLRFIVGRTEAWQSFAKWLAS